MSVDVGKAVGYLDLDISGFASGINEAYESINTFRDNSITRVGSILGGNLGAIYEVVENNEIEFGIKGDYQTTNITEYNNIINYGLYVGYNYKF